VLFAQLSSASAYGNHYSSSGISLQHSNFVAFAMATCLIWGTDDNRILWTGVAPEAREELMLMTLGFGPLIKRRKLKSVVGKLAKRR
jgi:hypothetical protein